MARRHIDELLDGIRFSGGGPVSISLETARRLKALHHDATEYDRFIGDEIRESLDALDEEMPEPKP